MKFKVGDRVKFAKSPYVSSGYRGYVTKIHSIYIGGLSVYDKDGLITPVIPLYYFTKPTKTIMEL